MALPVRIGVGTADRRNGDVTLTPTYPSGILAGDLLILHLGHNNQVTQAAATYTFPAGFAAKYEDRVTNTRQFIQFRRADGTETGTASITVSGGIAAGIHQAAIYCYRGAKVNADEGGAVASSTGTTTVSDAGVTTTGPDRLAMQFGTINQNNAAASFTGETGGDWTLVGEIANAPRMYVQSAAMAAAGTIDGGTWTMAVSSMQVVRGFALIPDEMEAQQPEARPPRLSSTRVIRPRIITDLHVAAAVADSGLAQPYPPATRWRPRRPARVIVPPSVEDAHVAIVAADVNVWQRRLRPSFYDFSRKPRFAAVWDYLVDAAVPGGTLPVYEGSGTYDRKDGDVTLAPAYSSPINAGDVLILQTGHINSSTQAAATYTFPGDWTELFADRYLNARQWIHRKVADGTEAGTISITVSGGVSTGFHQAVIHRFSSTDGTTIEGAAVTSLGSTTVLDADVTTTGANRLGLQLGFLSANQPILDFTGETGGDWTLATQTPTSATAKPFLQTAAMPFATTVGGGSFSKGAAGAWIVRGFALIYAAPVVPPVTPPSSQLGGGGGAIIPRERSRSIDAAIKTAWRKLFGPEELPDDVADIVADVLQDQAPQLLPDMDQIMRISAVLGLLSEQIERERAERDAEEIALLLSMTVA